MKSIAFLELSHVFANQAKLPYSTGCVWSYCRQNEIIQKNYSFNVKDWFYVLDDNFSVDDTVEQLKNIDIVGVSYFVWNVVSSDKVCKKLKEINPNVLIVYGGLGTPHHGRCEEFLNERPYVDVIVHNEGEYTFENLLVSLAEGKSLETVKGITTHDFVNPLERRVKNVGEMPSPYLDGLFDDLLKVATHNYFYEGLLEPDRGCPYSCTFCEVGDTFFNKVEKQPLEKLYKEIDWMSNNKIPYLHIVDNNFGMFKTHMDLSEYIIRKRNETSFPNSLNLSWAKAKKPWLFEIAKVLQDARLNKGVTIALQSLHEPTLQAIKRPNPEFKTLKDTIEKLKELKIPAYVELIIGLPLETVQTFKDGIFYLIDELNYHHYIGIYNLVSLPNTPFGDPEYCKKYEIKTSKTLPAFVHHNNADVMLQEDSNEIVTSTSTMTYEDNIKMTLWRWFMQSTHFLGWTRIAFLELKKEGITAKDFYTKFHDYMLNNDILLRKEYYITKNLIEKTWKREIAWGRKNLDVSKLFWDYEESTAIIIAQNKKLFYKELEDFILKTYKIKNTKQIVQKNYDKMKDPYVEYNGDIEKWAKECIWWGRRVEWFFVDEFI